MVKTGRRAAEAADAAAEEKPVEPPKASSVSLWHKIFGLPTEQTVKLSGSTADAEQAETTAEARRPMEGGWEEEFERPAQREPSEEAEAKVEREFDTDQRGKEPTTEEGRGRRPRRRRRGRKPDEERGEQRPAPRARRAPSRTSEEEADESFDFDDEFGGAPAGQQEFAAPPSFDEDADESELEEDFDEGGKPSSGRAAGHRNIPSWEDAIGAIVDHNLQSRTLRKPSGHPSGRGGPSRGRPRGGRRRNKP